MAQKYEKKKKCKNMLALIGSSRVCYQRISCSSFSDVQFVMYITFYHVVHYNIMYEHILR